jgi:hypothetical protein
VIALTKNGWLRRETSCGLLWTWWWTFCNICGISWLAEKPPGICRILLHRVS